MIQQLGRMSNRHGVVAGATGTGKTVTLQVMAEGFSRMGVPVFAVDVKGDLSGIAAAGKPHPKIDERLAKIPLPDYRQQPCPTVLWDIDGQNGHPVRTTISEMGPLLLSNLLSLNDTQTSVLYAGFDLADDQGLVLLDLKDLRSLLGWMGDNAGDLGSEYGYISKASLGAIQRRLLVLEEQGAELFFGEPAVQLSDLMHTDFSGRGVISILDVQRVIHQAPRVYGAFLLWLLAELFEQLPECGDPPAPKMVLFFDEAHMLFDYEMLKARAEAAQAQEAQLQADLEAAKRRQQEERSQRRSASGGRRRQSAGEAMVKSAARAIGSQIGRQIIRGILGSIFGRR